MNSMNTKLDVLRKREQALKAAIASEKVRQQRLLSKQFDRLKSVVGGALLANAAHHPDFELLLKGILRDAALEESDKKLLRSKGWL